MITPEGKNLKNEFTMRYLNYAYLIMVNSCTICLNYGRFDTNFSIILPYSHRNLFAVMLRLSNIMQEAATKMGQTQTNLWEFVARFGPIYRPNKALDHHCRPDHERTLSPDHWVPK